jgi:threonine synthase
MAAAERVRTDAPVVVLSTAHPAKFPDATTRGCGAAPVMPEKLRALFGKRERFKVLNADAASVRSFIEGEL